VPDDTGRVIVAASAPASSLLAVWVLWEGRADEEGWIVLQAGEAWAPAAEAFWRRRVHPGWNLLVWSQASTLPAGHPVVLRATGGGVPARWAAAEPVIGDRYHAGHFVEVRGLLAALAVAVGLGVIAVARAARSLPRPRAWHAALLAVLGLAAALRVRALTAQSLWFDEVLTAIGGQSLDWVLYTPQVFGHPPLHYLAGWLFSPSAPSEAALRAPFVVAGVATVAALAGLARRLVGPATALTAACVLAWSPFHVELSQTARPYALFLLLSVVSMAALLEAARTDNARAWAAFTATAALAVYTHYLGTTLLVLQALVAALVVLERRGRGAAAAAVSFAAVTVLLAPWLPVFVRLARAQLGEGDLPAATLQRLLVEVFVPQYLGPGAAATLGGVLVAGGLWAVRRQRVVVLVLALWLALPVVLIWVSQPSHFLSGRHLALVVPPLFVLLAHGLTVIAGGAGRMVAAIAPARSRRLVPLAAGVTAAVLLVAWALPVGAALRGYYESRHGADWRTVAAVLTSTVAADERVLATVGAAYPLRHYWREDVELIDPQQLDLVRPQAAGERVWVVKHRGWDRPPELDAWLEERGHHIGGVTPSWSQPGVDLYRIDE